MSEVVLGTACGVLFGPYCANIFNPRAWGGDINYITLEVMRITLAAGLFAIGVELPQSYLADHAKGLLVMVIPTMAFGWVVVAAIIYALFPALNFVSSLVIAACLTPTDPIISAAIVGGKFATKHVPLNLRRILAAESAANDGLAYPFLSLSIYLTIENSRRTAIAEWFLVGWLYQVIFGVVIGSVLGIAFSHLMKFSHRKGFIDRESYVAQYLALALFTIGVTRTLGSDDLLAAFAAGSAISWDGYFNTQTEDEVFFSVIDLLLNCGCFVYIGAWMPFNLFNDVSLDITPWRLVTLFIAVLALRRIPPLLLLYKWVPEITTWREALFSGHFGYSICGPSRTDPPLQMGVGAIFVSTLAVTELPTPHHPPQNQAELLAATLQTIVAFVVLGSIIIRTSPFALIVLLLSLTSISCLLLPRIRPADGLSIPFFSFGRNVRYRTISLTRSITARNTSAYAPDWLLWARRVPPMGNTPPDTVVGDVVDLETGLARKADPTARPEPEAASQDAPAKKGAYVPELGPASMISDAMAGPATLALDRDTPSERVQGSTSPPGRRADADVAVVLVASESGRPGSGSTPPPPAPVSQRAGAPHVCAMQGPGDVKNTDVNVKPVPGPGGDGAGRGALARDTPEVILLQPLLSAPRADEFAHGTRPVLSRASAPTSAAGGGGGAPPSPRPARFSPSADHEAHDGDRVPSGTGTGTDASVRSVRLPAERPAPEGGRVGTPLGRVVAYVLASVARDGSSDRGAPRGNKDAHFAATQ
ncbi:Sodium/hydrogen exchanger family-domain-containing protein [Trametes elegans]|nr:Sodium/hydrogen exchanger family-domain-containing protein [Trametes elegans]